MLSHVDADKLDDIHPDTGKDWEAILSPVLSEEWEGHPSLCYYLLLRRVRGNERAHRYRIPSGGNGLAGLGAARWHRLSLWERLQRQRIPTLDLQDPGAWAIIHGMIFGRRDVELENAALQRASDTGRSAA